MNIAHPVIVVCAGNVVLSVPSIRPLRDRPNNLWAAKPDCAPADRARYIGGKILVVFAFKGGTGRQ